MDDDIGVIDEHLIHFRRDELRIDEREMNGRFLMGRSVVFQLNCRLFRDWDDLDCVYHINIAVAFIDK